MALNPDQKITTQILLTGLLLFALIDALYIPILARAVKKAAFLQGKWWIITSAAVFWFSLWSWVLSWGWDIVYAFVFPVWSRRIIPFGMALLFGLLAYGLWKIACSRPRPALSFLLLGSLTGALSHVYAVIIGITRSPVVLQGAHPAAAVAIAAFEFMFYWCIVLTAALGLRRVFWQVARLCLQPHKPA